jgi:hypothetical protein
MTYKDYKGFTKAFVIVYVTGNGTMESKFTEHHVVFESDDKEEADEKAWELTLKNNRIGEIKSSWYNNRYHVNVNTLSDKGRMLLSEFDKKIRALKDNSLF